MTIAILKNICYTPYYRKLTLHEINPAFKSSRLIMSFIFVYVNFRDLNFSRFGLGNRRAFCMRMRESAEQQ